MYKVFTLNIAKDSKGVSNYKINRLFMQYFTMKFLFFTLFYNYDIVFFVDSLKDLKNSIFYNFRKKTAKYVQFSGIFKFISKLKQNQHSNFNSKIIRFMSSKCHTRMNIGHVVFSYFSPKFYKSIIRKTFICCIVSKGCIYGDPVFS